MGYLSTRELVDRVKSEIVLLDSQEKTLYDLAATISLYCKRLQALDNGANERSVPRVSQLLVAPTGCGKTFLIKALAKAAGISFISIDASVLTPAGYKGENLNEAIIRGLRGAGIYSNRPRAIVLIDEFDKTCPGKGGRDREWNPQSNFLTILEGGMVSGDGASIDCEEILFLFSGAFEGIGRRRPQTHVGFYAELKDPGEEGQVTLEDVVNYGISRELAGRIGSILQIDKPKHSDFVKLIREKDTGVESQYAALFRGNDVDFSITDAAIQQIAEEAVESDIGVRAVNPLIRQNLLNAVKAVDEDVTVRKVLLDGENGKLLLRYEHGPKPIKSVEPAPDTDGVKEIADWDKQNIADLIRDENSLMSLCCELLPANRVEPAYALLFFFYQCAFRYLANRVIEEERTLESVLKLASCTEHEEGQPSSFDLLISDYLKLCKGRPEEITMSYFYGKFKEMKEVCGPNYLYQKCRKSLRRWGWREW